MIHLALITIAMATGGTQSQETAGRVQEFGRVRVEGIRRQLNQKGKLTDYQKQGEQKISHHNFQDFNGAIYQNMVV